MCYENPVDIFWHEFQTKNAKYKTTNRPPSFHFCDNETDANDCAVLVRKGIKRATTHSLDWLQLQKEKLPAPGDLSIVTDWNRNPTAVIQTVKVEIVHFKDITPEYAFIEGEGDKSLAYWEKVHWDYYKRELSGYSLKPTFDMKLVCEYFETIWPENAG